MSVENMVEHCCRPHLQLDVDTITLQTFEVGDKNIISTHRAGSTTLNQFYQSVEMTARQIIDSDKNFLLVCRDPVERFQSSCRLAKYTLEDMSAKGQMWRRRLNLDDFDDEQGQGMIGSRLHFQPYMKYFVNCSNVLTYRWDKFKSEHEDRTHEDDPIGFKMGSKNVQIDVVPYPEIWEDEIQAYKYMTEVNQEGWLSG